MHVGKSRRSEQLRSLGRLKTCNKKGEIGDVPAAWEAHFAGDFEFSCINVYELLLRNKINPIYDSTGRRLFAAGAPAEELPPLPRDDNNPESSDSESNNSNSSDSESNAD